MKKRIIDEKTEIPYTLVGDYYLPWGDLPDDEPEHKPIGIWGQRHLRYIKQHKRLLYTEMLTSGMLNDYLVDINEQVEEMFFRLVKQLAEKDGVTEKLKAENQMLWVQRMNNINNQQEKLLTWKSFINKADKRFIHPVARELASCLFFESIFHWFARIYFCK